MIFHIQSMQFLSFIFLSLLVFQIATAHDLGERLSFNVGTDLYQAHYKQQRYKFDNYGAFKTQQRVFQELQLV